MKEPVLNYTNDALWKTAARMRQQANNNKHKMKQLKQVVPLKRKKKKLMRFPYGLETYLEWFGSDVLNACWPFFFASDSFAHLKCRKRPKLAFRPSSVYKHSGKKILYKPVVKMEQGIFKLKTFVIRTKSLHMRLTNTNMKVQRDGFFLKKG